LSAGKLLINADEVSSLAVKLDDALKARITNETMNVNQKCVAGFDIDDYTNFVFTSNNASPVRVPRTNNRRFFVDSNRRPFADPKENWAYFKPLIALMDTPGAAENFYAWLKEEAATGNYDNWNNEDIPETVELTRLKKDDIPIIGKWFQLCVVKGTLTVDEMCNFSHIPGVIALRPGSTEYRHNLLTAFEEFCKHSGSSYAEPAFNVFREQFGFEKRMSNGKTKFLIPEFEDTKTKMADLGMWNDEI